jgi:hypothetical protein
MKEVVAPLLIAFAAMLFVIVGATFLVLLTTAFRVHARTEQRILSALNSHYAPAYVEVENRVDWYNGGSDFSFGGTVCLDVNVRHFGESQSVRKIALVESDSDGGAWTFVGEQPSMDVCKSYFWRG